MAIDLNSMSLKELKDLQSQVAKAISGYEDRKKSEAIQALEEKARDMGFALSELLGAGVGKKKRVVKAKYANPADSSQTWTGRGRRPKWVEAALAGGKSLSDFAI